MHYSTVYQAFVDRVNGMNELEGIRRHEKPEKWPVFGKLVDCMSRSTEAFFKRLASYRLCANEVSTMVLKLASIPGQGKLSLNHHPVTQAVGAPFAHSFRDVPGGSTSPKDE